MCIPFCSDRQKMRILQNAHIYWVILKQTLTLLIFSAFGFGECYNIAKCGLYVAYHLTSTCPPKCLHTTTECEVPHRIKMKLLWFLKCFVYVIYLNRRASATEMNDMYRNYINIRGDVYSCCHFTLASAKFQAVLKTSLKLGLLLLRYQPYGLSCPQHIQGLVPWALMGTTGWSNSNNSHIPSYECIWSKSHPSIFICLNRYGKLLIVILSAMTAYNWMHIRLMQWNLVYFHY